MRMTLLVPLLILTAAGHTSGLITGLMVTSCDACHKHATCLTSPDSEGLTSPILSLSCVCNEGFSGDGFTCTPSPLAPSGVNQVSHSGRRRRRGAVPTTNPNLAHVRFDCGFIQCPDGQDCLSAPGGYQQCADPCSNYQVLDDAWRSTSYRSKDSSDLHCDRNVAWEGWYRMQINNTSAFMPDKCVDQYMCGTQAALWLAFPPPELIDQIVQSTVCASFRGSCCWMQSNLIHVKACQGNYYVYKFVPPPGCYFAYCAAVDASQPTIAPIATTTKASQQTTTPTVQPTPLPTSAEASSTSQISSTTSTPMCAACPQGEVCVSHDGVTWKCEKPGHPDLPEPLLHCGHSAMEVGLQQAKLQTIGLDAFSAHLADPRCHDHAEKDGAVWYRVERTEGTCGNTLRTNGTHALYSNSLFVYPVPIVSFVRPLSMPFTCAYPLDGDSGINIAVRPYLSVDNAAVGMGTAVQATMSLFQNANYTEPYPAGPITKDVGSVLYVGVTVDEMESERFVVVLEECYASHSSSPKDLMRYYLIQNRCSTEERFVKLDESGSSLKAHFAVLLFLYQGDYQDVFLHCSFSLCDQWSSSCSPVCGSKRRTRSVEPSATLQSVTVGPIQWA